MAKFDFSGIKSAHVEPGRYHVALVDGSIEHTGENAKHPNAEHWNLEFDVQDGPNEGRKLWCRVMLPPYEPFMLYNILVGTGEFDRDELKSDGAAVALFEDSDDYDEGDYVLVREDEDEYLHFIVDVKKQKNDPEGRTQITQFMEFDGTWEPEDDD